MKQFVCLYVFAIICCLTSQTSAETLANEKLLEFLKENGFLTEEQVGKVKDILKNEEAKTVETVYEDGIHIRTKDKEFDVRIGGLIQSDWVNFGSHYPIDSDFDIRRARFFIMGRVFKYFNYKFETEFEGSSNDRLVDAYINFDYFPSLKLQTGQFKEPFSLENLIADKDLPFTERSMAFSLTPGRDVGFMAYGSLLHDSVQYSAGVFNGDGRDADRRSQKDDKEVTGRIVIQPFRAVSPLLKGLQFGGSFSYARLDTSDLKVDVKTPARTTFFKVTPRAKYSIIRDVDDRTRLGFELAYFYGPFVLIGEYIKNQYEGVRLSDTDSFDFDLRAWYVSMLFMLTGENPSIKGGVLEKIRPKNCFDMDERRWGAFGVGLRYEQFEAGRNVYSYLVQEGYSVKKACSLTAALNWYLNNMIRLSMNYSRTWFAQSLFLGTSPEGYSYYNDAEDVWFTQFQLEF